MWVVTAVVDRLSRVGGQAPFMIADVSRTLLRGTIIIRTCDQHKNLCNPLFLLAICGPDYYVPR